MIIAERNLLLKSEKGDHVVKVTVSAPFAEGASWFCAFTIDWPEGTRSLKVGGADSMQALVCALQLLGAELYASRHHKKGTLRCEPPGSGYGIPVPPNFRPDLVGDDAKYL